MRNLSVLFTNPPYHSLNEDGVAVGRLWWNIVIKSLEDNPERAMLIVPSSFHTPGSFQTPRYKPTKLVNMGYYITHLQSGVALKFDNISIPISYINLSREHPEHAFIDEHPFYVKNNLLDGKYPIPFFATKNSCNIIRKCFNLDQPHRPSGIRSAEDGYKGSSAYGVVLQSGRFGYWDNRYIGKLEDCTVYGESLFYDKKDHESMTSIFSLNLYRYMFRTLGGESQQSRFAAIRFLPRLSTDKIWTDKEVYEKFDLSDDEIKDIELDAGQKYKKEY